MPAIPRQKILEKFRRMIADGVPIVGGGAGTGLSAKAEEAGGIDLIIIYNSGRYRMAGRGSAAGLLAYGNANEIVKEMAYEVLPVVKHTPVLAGVNGTDPFVIMPLLLAELKTMGFSGVQNFPTIGLFDGSMRQSFEETGMGFGLEVDMIAEAHKLDLLTTPYVFNPDEAKAMTKAGADIVVAHMGVTTGGSIGATSAKSLDDCVARDRRHRRRGPLGAQGRHPALPWRPDLDAGRRPLHSRPLHGTARLLRRLEHGAPAGRGGDPRPDGELQEHRRRQDNVQQLSPGAQAMTSEKNFLYAKDVNTFAFDWGRLALTVAPETNGATRFSGGIVDLGAGQGHTRHNHPGAEEIIFVISGNGEQMVEDPDGNPVVQKVSAGCTIYVPESRFHSTLNTGDGPMQLFVVYSPAGPELALRDLPDFRLVPPGGK